MYMWVVVVCSVFFFQAEDGIRDLVRSRGLGDVYKRQVRAGFEAGIAGCVESAEGRRCFVESQLLVLAVKHLSLIHI